MTEQDKKDAARVWHLYENNKDNEAFEKISFIRKESEENIKNLYNENVKKLLITQPSDDFDCGYNSAIRDVMVIIKVLGIR